MGLTFGRFFGRLAIGVTVVLPLYGVLLDGALESIAGRLDALDRARDDEAEEASR